MPQRERSNLPLEAAAGVVAAALPIAACLALGGAHPLAHALLGALALLAAALLVVDRQHAHRPVRTSWIIAPLAVGLLATLAALVPLPQFLRAAIDADGADRVARVAALAGVEGVGLQFLRPVLAYDPPEAALAALRSLTALVAFLVLAHVAGRTRARRVVHRVLGGGAALLFVVALAHGVLERGDTSAWGLVPSSAGFFHAPLVNANHLGKVFAALALLCVGRGLTIRRGRESGALVAVGLLCALGVWWTDSRGSLAALAAGALVLGVLVAFRLRAQRPRDGNGLMRDAGDPSTRRARFLAGAACAVVVAAIVLCTVGAGAVADLAALDPEGAFKSKARLWPWGWLVAREHALVGTAPGAFGLVLPSHIPFEEAFGSPHMGAALDASRFRYTHVENVVLQTLVDHGLLLGGLLLASVVVVTWHVVASGAAADAPGAAAAVAALLAGDLVDFALEVPAGLLLAAVALALVAGKAQPRLASVSFSPWPAPSLVVAALALLLSWVGMRDWRRGVSDELEGLLLGERRPALLRALARHPSDAQLAYALAVDARMRGDERAALRFANRALVLWPQHRGAHVEAGRALVALGNVGQALIEYRAAWRSGWPDAALLDEVLTRFPAYEQRRAAFPDEPAALAHLCQALRARAAPDAQTCFDEVGSLPGATPEQRAVAIHHAMERGDLDGALARIEADIASAPPDAAAALALALERRDGVASALTRTERWRFTHGALPFLAWRARAAAMAGRDDVVERTLAELDASTRDTREFLAVKRVHADVHERRGQLAEALDVVAMLAARAPGDVETWLWKGRLERKLGLKLQAAETAARAQRAWPDDPRVKAFVNE